MRYVLLTFFTLVFFVGIAQKRKRVNWTEWSDSTAFFQGKIPIITGYGHFSDSLSAAYNGKTFFVAKGIYYVINSAADYYLWFTTKYPYLFDESIEIYRNFYLEKDNYNMLNFIENTYNGVKLPLKFVRIRGYYRNRSEGPMEDQENTPDQLVGKRSGYGSFTHRLNWQ